MSFDLATIVVIAVALGALMGVLQLATWLQMREETPLALWGLADLLCVFAALVSVFDGGYRSPLVAPLASACFLLASGAIYLGMRAFDGARIAPWGVALVTASAVGFALVSILFLRHSVNARIILFTVIICGWLVAAAWRLVRVRRHASAFTRLLTAVFLSLLCAFHLARLVAAAFGVDNDASHISASALALALAVGLFCVVGLNCGAIFMVLDRLASCDDLTGLSNRRALLRAGERACRAAVARGRPLSVLLADLDHFKSVNDAHGHRTGDRVLQEFAAIAGDMVRPGDLVGRYGGEEFCIVLPGADAEAATALAERLRDRVARGLATLDGLPLHVTVTIGLASLEADGMPDPSVEALIDAADDALYAAKDGGRNRVIRAQPRTARPLPDLPPLAQPTA